MNIELATKAYLLGGDRIETNKMPQIDNYVSEEAGIMCTREETISPGEAGGHYAKYAREMTQILSRFPIHRTPDAIRVESLHILNAHMFGLGDIGQVTRHYSNMIKKFDPIFPGIDELAPLESTYPYLTPRQERQTAGRRFTDYDEHERNRNLDLYLGINVTNYLKAKAAFDISYLFSPEDFMKVSEGTFFPQFRLGKSRQLDWVLRYHAERITGKEPLGAREQVADYVDPDLLSAQEPNLSKYCKIKTDSDYDQIGIVGVENMVAVMRSQYIFGVGIGTLGTRKKAEYQGTGLLSTDICVGAQPIYDPASYDFCLEDDPDRELEEVRAKLDQLCPGIYEAFSPIQRYYSAFGKLYFPEHANESVCQRYGRIFNSISAQGVLHAVQSSIDEDTGRAQDWV